MSIPVIAGADADLSSISLVFENLPYWDFTGAVTRLNPDNFIFNPEGDKLYISWYSLEPEKVITGDTLFYLLFNTKAICQLTPYQAFLFIGEFTDENVMPISNFSLRLPEYLSDRAEGVLIQNISESRTLIPDHRTAGREGRDLQGSIIQC